MKIGDLVKSNVDYQVGIVIEVRPPHPKDWRTKFCVQFPEGLMWLTNQVLEAINESR